MCNQQVSCPHPWLIWCTTSVKEWHKNTSRGIYPGNSYSLFRVSSFVGLPEVRLILLACPKGSACGNVNSLVFWYRNYVQEEIYLVCICSWKHIWTFQLWKFFPVADMSAYYHMNHEFSTNCEWLQDQSFYSTQIMQWLTLVQAFLHSLTKFLQQTMFKFYYFNDIQHPVERKCRKITCQNHWMLDEPLQ